MKLSHLHVSIGLILLLFCPQINAISLDDLEEDDGAEAVSVVPSQRFEWSGLFDMRLVNAGGAKNWADSSGNWGGPGLTRYGAGSGGERHTNFQLGMIGIVADFISDDKRVAHLQLNYSDHQSGRANDWGELGIAEAYIQEELPWLDLRLGFLIPEISLEHPEIAWSTRYTITPSAINTWIGEEVRSLGLELKVKPTPWSAFTLASFSHNDAIATVLTYRGWALHDYQGT
ncbi:MAG: hypothetical protein HRU19_20265 [Pseudobacteriovorax sp.]|nr:hypothetical protein [Pseudobacteriovorax sp.]